MLFVPVPFLRDLVFSSPSVSELQKYINLNRLLVM